MIITVQTRQTNLLTSRKQSSKSVDIANQELNSMNMQTVNLNQTSNVKTQSIGLETIQTWLVTYLSQLLEIEPTTVDISHSFESYGLDSSTTIALTADLEDWLSTELDPTLLYEYSTIEELSQYVFEKLQGH